MLAAGRHRWRRGEGEDKLLYVVTHLLHHIYRVDIVGASLTPRSTHTPGPPSSARPGAAHPGRRGAAGVDAISSRACMTATHMHTHTSGHAHSYRQARKHIYLKLYNTYMYVQESGLCIHGHSICSARTQCRAPVHLSALKGIHMYVQFVFTELGQFVSYKR